MSQFSDNYHSKYLKYKNKYLDLKQEISGGAATVTRQLGPIDEITALIATVTELAGADIVSGYRATNDIAITPAKLEEVSSQVLDVSTKLTLLYRSNKKKGDYINDMVTLIDAYHSARSPAQKEVKLQAIETTKSNFADTFDRATSDNPDNQFWRLLNLILKIIEDKRVTHAEKQEWEGAHTALASTNAQINADLVAKTNELAMTKFGRVVRNKLNQTKIEKLEAEKQNQIEKLEAEKQALQKRNNAINSAVGRLLDYYANNIPKRTYASMSIR
jgi:hypothetical protein